MKFRTLARALMAALVLVAGLAVLRDTPAAVQLFTNNASTTLASPLSSTANSMAVTSGTGSQFPTLTGGNWFIGTLQHVVSGAVTAQEIVKVTGRTGDTMAILRGQEGTTPQSWSAGDFFSLLPTAGGLGQFVQPAQAQAQAYNYAVDTGSANSYVVALAPVVSAHVVGMPITFKAAHSNTGGSIFNDGAGAATIVRQDLTTMQGGEIQGGTLNTVIWDGTFFELTSSIGNWVLKSPPGAGAQSISGPLFAPQFVASGPQASTLMELDATDAPTNQGQWIWTLSNNSLALGAWSDNHGTVTTAMSVTRSGASVQNVSLGGSSQSGTTQSSSDSSTNFATTAFVKNVLSTSPALGGTPTAPTASAGTSTTQLATTAFATAIASGTVGTNGSITLEIAGAPSGHVIIKWGFHSPGTTAGAGLETITFPVAFPNHCYFAAAFSNRNSTGTVGTGAVYQPSLSTSSFQAVLDQDGSGNRSGLWMAVGD